MENWITKQRFPFEEENRIAIIEANSRHLRNAMEVLQVGLMMLDALITGPHPPRRILIDWVTEAILLESLRRYRSIIALVEIGQIENAEILTRSLFETALAGMFVLENKKRHAKDIVIPKRWNHRHFRAALYFSYRPLKLDRLRQKLANQRPSKNRRVYKAVLKSLDPIARVADNLRKRMTVGEPSWFSGLTPQQMAQRHGWSDYHNHIYGLQSDTTHGTAALDRVQLTEDGDLIAKLKADIHAVPETLYLAANILEGLLGVVDRAFKLGFKERLREVNDAILAAVRDRRA